MEKPNQPNKLAGFFHGIDPATQNDYYTDVVHALAEKPHRLAGVKASSFKWVPFLVGVMRMRKQDPNDMMDFQITMFNRFPPTFATIDSSREDFLTAGIQRKYGDTKIIPMKFGNVGSMNTKFQLKQLGYSYINAGYEWPNIIELETTNPKLAKVVRILQKEMMMEQVKFTETDRVTFSHPVGKHNDLVHGWEMSLNSVMTFQKKNLGFERRGIDNPLYNDMLNNIYKSYPRSKESNYDAVEEKVMRGGSSALPY